MRVFFQISCMHGHMHIYACHAPGQARFPKTKKIHVANEIFYYYSLQKSHNTLHISEINS